MKTVQTFLKSYSRSILVMLLLVSSLLVFGQEKFSEFSAGANSPLDLSDDECMRLRLAGHEYSHSESRKSYDTLRYFMENCTFYKGASSAFSTISGSAGVLIHDGEETHQNLRNWLKSVLHLNPDSFWYCSDAYEIARSYWYPLDGVVGHPEDGDAAVTVIKYLADSSGCWMLQESLGDMWELFRSDQYHHWRDTVNDSLVTPYDTTIKTLEELDLTILRGPKTGVVEEERMSRFGEMYVRRNPFTDVVELRYELLRDTWSKVEVYDMLGRSLYTESTGFQAKGEHNITIDGRQWSSGTYYVRLSSVSGDVKTVKVMKE